MTLEQSPTREITSLDQNRRLAVQRLNNFLKTPEETALRAHQVTMTQALADFLQEGTAGYISAAGASGKNTLMVMLAEALGLKTVILTHTKQVLEQTDGEADKFTPDLEVGKYYQHEKSLGSKTTIITYPSILSLLNDPKKAGQFDPKTVELLLCDESDVALGEKRHTIFRRFPNAVKVGFTATAYFDPLRGFIRRGIVREDEEWTGLFTNQIFELPLEETMERKIAAEADVFLVKTDTKVSQMQIMANDEYRKEDIKRNFDRQSRNLLAVAMIAGLDSLPKDFRMPEDKRRQIEEIHRKIKGKRTLLFAIDIDHAEKIAKSLRDNGIRAKAVHGELDSTGKLRRKILKDHKKGKTQVIVSVDMLGRGWNSPETEVGIFARPTHSGTVAAQQFYRILRQSPETGKERAIAIQLVDDFERKQDGPVLIPDLFDPYYILRGTQTGKGPSVRKNGATGEAQKKKEIVNFYGIDVDVIIQDARTRDLLRKRFTQGSVKEIADFADGLFAQVKSKKASITSYDLIKKAVEQLPQKMPLEVQEKAMQAIASVDTNTRALGRKVFLLLNMKTFLSVVSAFYIEGIDSLEDRDEMLISAMVHLMGKVDAGMTINTQVSSQINRTARDGVVEFLKKKYDMPTGLIRDPQDKLFVLKKVKEELETGYSTRGSIQNLAHELSEETGVNKKEVLNWLMFLNAGKKSERKKLSFEQEGDIYLARETTGLKEQMKRVLDTLNARERRVLELSHGLEEGSEALTLEETGREFGVTRERIRQIEKKALRKLRHPSRAKKLMDYAEGQEDSGKAVDLSIARFYLDPRQKKLVMDSGIREIGNFFSATPQELAEEWLGSPQGLANIMRVHLMPILDNISDKLKTREGLLPEEMEIFTHITNAIFYRMNREPEFSPIERVRIYEKACEEIVGFIKKMLPAQYVPLTDFEKEEEERISKQEEQNQFDREQRIRREEDDY